jgi:uridine phosphorylase
VRPHIYSSDLLLNKDGSVFHLNLLPEHIGNTIITVGDPNRVYQISRHFDDIHFEMNRREFITHVGTFKGKKVSVISTGIGSDNIEIFLTELDALFNVDFKTGRVKQDKTQLKIVRIGTSSALQEDIAVGSHLVSEYGVGFDNTMQFYNLNQTVYERQIAREIQGSTMLAFTPYVVKGSELLMEKVGFDMRKGNSVSASGFYAPQAREVRLPIKYPKLIEQLNYYHDSTGDFWLTNFEMETAPYYALGRLLEHDVLSVNAILANRITREEVNAPGKVLDELIVKVLERI